jgi:hypothetical protein
MLRFFRDSFGNSGKQPRRRARKRRLGIQDLEERKMMTADGVAPLPAGPPAMVGDVDPGANANEEVGDQNDGEEGGNAGGGIVVFQPIATTVQLPTFAVTTVTTTVSVPDGGTVLLGGIKRLSEGRTERGVPTLNKIPYVNRLFNNVGVGQDAQSLMMMVTPRIIIQEEE